MFVLLSILFIFFVELVLFEGNDEWFGDGMMWQMLLLSLVIYLGVNCILVVGVVLCLQLGWYDMVLVFGYLLFVQIVGQVLVSIFFDGFFVDIEWFQYVNVMVVCNFEIVDVCDGWCKIEVLVMVLFECIELIVLCYVQCLLGMVCVLFKLLGGIEVCGVVFVSYLFFELEFIQELIDLGECDVQVCCDELVVFLYGVILDMMCVV